MLEELQEMKNRVVQERENLIKAKIKAIIKDIRDGNEQSKDNGLNYDDEIYVLLDMLEKAGFELGKDFAFEEAPFEYDETVPELHIRVGDEIIRFSGMYSRPEIISIQEIEEDVKDDPESYNAGLLELKSIDLDILGINEEIQSVEFYRNKATEVRENLVRAKIKAIIKDMRGGNEQSRDNGVNNDNEIYILLGMLERAGLKEGEDFAFEEASLDDNETVPEMHIRIGDEIIHLSGMYSRPEVISMQEVEEDVKDDPESYNARLVGLKSIDLEKLDILEYSNVIAENISLEWYETIKQMNLEGKTLEDIPDEEKALYKEQFGELKYNWEAIYYAIFQDKARGFERAQNHMEIPTCAIPAGMKELFETDESGKPTGKYNWDYIMQLVKESSGYDITEYNNMNIANDNGITGYMPSHAGIVLENIDNPSELYESLIGGGLDTNCPKEIRENPDTMLGLFEMADGWDELEFCFELMDDKLLEDKKFLLSLLGLYSVQENPSLLENISSSIYMEDEEIKQAIIDCWGVHAFYYAGGELDELWEVAMENIGDEEFYDAISNYELDLLEEENPFFVGLVNLEVEARRQRKLQAVAQTITETENIINPKGNEGPDIK